MLFELLVVGTLKGSTCKPLSLAHLGPCKHVIVEVANTALNDLHKRVPILDLFPCELLGWDLNRLLVNSIIVTSSITGKVTTTS